MERVSTLLKKLQQQYDQKSSVQSMLHTVQILHSELINHLEKEVTPVSSKVSVVMPFIFKAIAEAHNSDSTLVEAGERIIEEEEKIIEVLKVDEKEIEEELEQIKKHADTVNAMSSHVRKDFNYDPIEEVPTLSQQSPASDFNNRTENYNRAEGNKNNELQFEYPESLNDRLKQVKIELSQSLENAPIKDLKKAIGVNDRFLFINELFRGDVAMYERSIKTIQNFSIYPEAEFWIRRELKVKIGWVDSDPVVKQFDALVKRRFGS
jgi:vacuolar-type H+-ATPase subunit I/STV1